MQITFSDQHKGASKETETGIELFKHLLNVCATMLSGAEVQTSREGITE